MTSEKIYKETKELRAKKEKLQSEIAELESKEENLHNELKEVLVRESKLKEQQYFTKIKEAILRIWDIVWPDEDDDDNKKRLDEITDAPRLLLWLEADVANALKVSKLEKALTIRTICKDIPNLDFDKCYNDAKIRLDFSSALKSVKEGSDLAPLISYSFSEDDIRALMELHRKNRFRTKIEDLLEYCNFHQECGMMSDGKYEELEQFLREEAA